MQIILDISANTHKNDEVYYKRMIDELAKVDSRKHEVILKWQLWTDKMGDNLMADETMFPEMAFWAWNKHGYKTTASVFDYWVARDCLLRFARVAPYELPFIKIANRHDLDWLIGEIPRKYIIYKSTDSIDEYLRGQIDYFDAQDIMPLFCISEYPADINKYPEHITCISDHTVGLKLFHRNKPKIWEKHFKLSDSTGLDAGDFAITPEELRRIL